jgi:hypothetical protein
MDMQIFANGTSSAVSILLNKTEPAASGGLFIASSA